MSFAAEVPDTMTHPRKPAGTLRRALTLGTAAGTSYGAWALIVNWSHGTGAALRAAGAQCTISFISTLFMAVILERLFTLGRSPTQGFWLASIGTTGVSAFLMAITHILAGTPRILATMAPLVAVAAFVYTSYALKLLVGTTFKDK